METLYEHLKWRIMTSNGIFETGKLEKKLLLLL